MKIEKQIVFKGRNIYSHKKCIRLDVDLCGYSETPSRDIADFNSKLVMMIPELRKHRCGIDEEGGFVKRLEEGTYLAHICEHIIIALQNILGINVCYGKAREKSGDYYYIIFEYQYEHLGLEVARLAVDIVNSLIDKEKINFEGRMKLLEEILCKESMGPSTKSIKDAADKYGIPMFPLGDTGFYQIGYGKQGRVIEATIGDKTSCVAADIASDKELTKKLLYNQNIPVPDGREVKNVIDLLIEGERIGYPLVLKPRYGNKGNGVILNIKDDKELIQEFNNMKNKYNNIILEKHIKGNDYRVCVVDREVVAVALRIPPFVIGNGRDNLKELIRELNDNSSRGDDHEKPLTKVKIDSELINFLNGKGLSLNNIPRLGEKINLREKANLSTGGMSIDCTDDICEENKKICIRAAKAIGLDICGIDIKTTDISKPLDNNSGIMEINAAPGIRMHTYPYEGKSRDVGESILKLQYNGNPFNIPVVSITGTNGKTTTTRLTSHVLAKMGYKVGMTCTDGIYIDGECIDKGDDTGYYSAKTVLLNKDVEIAVLETARGGLVRKGLAYDLADVAAITNITEDHIGIDEINSISELAKIKALVGEAVKPNGYVVLNADDKWSTEILDRIKAKKIFFSKYKDNEHVIKNIKNGDIAVYIDNNILCVTNNKKKYKILNTDEIPITLGGILEFNIENVMASCGVLVGMGVDYSMISIGFKTFQLDTKCNSGRFNMFDINGIKIVLDYGHNLEGYKAVLSSFAKIKKEKLIGVIGVPGDRQDEMIESIGYICSKYIDNIIIKEDIDRRGRDKGEVAEILKRGVVKGNNHKYKICLNEVEALKEAIKFSKAGDYIIVFYEKLEPLIEVVREYNNLNEDLNLANL
ncbi:cyanophycin synthetase [Clostridium sp. SHJSY1]|uniref:cyanophycin synthetase n=1 Tax=Clostridium sp. SHJSY1 TaxID=2942483 RepID=UPI0028766EBD|nr:cyanophycin synthetase [Clostridium sp. SHJSY1]MDS0528285.1 cyanophycin synthetase [Clostridium sp. SHJSY1]